VQYKLQLETRSRESVGPTQYIHTPQLHGLTSSAPQPVSATVAASPVTAEKSPLKGNGNPGDERWTPRPCVSKPIIHDREVTRVPARGGQAEWDALLNAVCGSPSLTARMNDYPCP
jgi:hypothetical protein